jgi:HlyD family secretion protein
MDRPLPDSALRNTRVRQALQIAVPLVAIVTILALLPGWMRPTLTRARIRTATVQAGAIEAVITASGTVMPEIERVLSSPVDARLLRLLKRAGATVAAGESVAELDLGESRLALERIATSLRISDNQQAQTRLALDKSLADLDARLERKALELQMLEEKAASSRQLSEQGLVSQQALRESTLAVKQAAIELAQLRHERGNAERSTVLQSEGLALQRAAMTKEEIEARRTLELATTRSDRDGVLTWVLPQEGALVRRGEVVARIADLSSFRVDASVSDIHAGRVRAGIPVVVVINEARLDGTISDVLPSVDNDIIRFTVALRERSHALLRPNMRVDVLVITDRRSRTLTVRQGPFAGGGERGDVFVVRGGRARKTPVQFGLRGFDDVEVVSGLNEGDEVVISDMRDYLHLDEMEVK